MDTLQAFGAEQTEQVCSGGPAAGEQVHMHGRGESVTTERVVALCDLCIFQADK